MLYLALLASYNCVAQKIMTSDNSSIGTATMAPDGTMEFRLMEEFSHLGEIYFRYALGTPDYIWALKYIGGIKPGEKKDIPTFPKSSYNTASMRPDRAIRLAFRPAELPGGGMSGPLIVELKPGEARYDEALRYVGNIKPGESKLVPPCTTTFFKSQ